MTMTKNVGHLCSMDDKYCREGADPARQDSSLPVNHPTQHDSHMGGCICPLGDKRAFCDDCGSTAISYAQIHDYYAYAIKKKDW